ncbi:ReoY family proteolytic degradation factor [Texcoconibacillus texcoconensis]|uniref:UPF0302 protein HNQ41_001037 n=1 Tax=Texcoconibacillus texcoconensis TaxID=1095777 RepID=A0A840QNC3_9BACI|nr:ReoY family proteolytic degradation factor [Texcoconibacillus texcoconensis]MBB5172874.1 uncharacterized protein YpiB (UPF0302 family) [Texcoconibacillus texcoconensis]
MNSSIPVMEKRDFLKWFLDEYQLKRRECAWLLNYLMSDDSLMERVHFVEQAEHCPKALLISTSDVDKVPFAFHKKQHVTMDAEKAFHDIRLNRHENVFVQLYFTDRLSVPQYVAVLEENPYLPANEEEINLRSLLAEMVMDQSLRHYRKEWLKQKIDESLKNKDEQSFNQYVKEYEQLRALDV